MKVCILGNNLTALTLAKTLVNLKINVEILYIKKNLDSILNQNYKLWRIIYIDNNSSDNTYDLVNNYIKNNNLYLKCKLIRNNNCMNEGYNRFVSYNLVDDDENNLELEVTCA